MGNGGSPSRTLNKRSSWGSLWFTRTETIPVCHALLQDLKFFKLLLLMDEELATQTRADGCPCGGILHRANYPRKPRGCLDEVRPDYAFRFSFCCNACRKRSTSTSVRFLGRRVYLGLAVVLMSARHAGPTSAVMRTTQALAIPIRTLQRWRQWWRDQFPQTGFWQAACAHFMPSVETPGLPASLLDRFSGAVDEALLRLLVFLSPITAGHPVTLREGC